MAKKLIVIGGNPAGLSCASAVRRAHADWDIIVYEKGQYVSYGSCGLPYFIGGIVEDASNLITLTPETLLNKRNIPLKLNHEVIKVDFNSRKIKVKNLQSEDNEVFEDDYDYLMIATGAKAIKLEGISIDHPRVFDVHVIPDAIKVKNFVEKEKPKSGVLIGAKYIGLEMVEAFLKAGVKYLTIIGPNVIFTSKHKEFIINELEKHGIRYYIGKYVKKVEPISDKTLKIIADDLELTADFVQVSAGVKPNTDIFNGTKLKMIKGAIDVNEYMQTNIENVYAGGDCVLNYHRILKKKVYIPLAPAANKHGRIAGNHIAGKKIDPFGGIIGTAIWKTFDLHCAKTGITLKQAKEAEYDADEIFIQANEVAHYYPNKGKMSVLLVFDRKSHILLGAEITSPTPLGAKKIDVLATAIYAQMTIDQIQQLDLAYAPPFAPVWDPILVAANVARKKCL
ncbi:MAG: FAD-dependent oxidoreductase [Promethearchaeota archaeon]